MRFIIGFLAIALAAVATVAAAQDARTEYVRFAPGASGTTITDRITGYESVDYKIGAEGGQRMKIRLEPSNLATYFNVYAPGSAPGGEALANAQLMGPMVPDLNVFDGVLPVSGEYTVSVYMMRSAARRNEVSDYTLTIGIAGALPEAVQGDFADGLQGGPDFLQVATSGGGTLNLRAGPSGGAAVVARLANGQNVRNLGCRMAEGRRWCQVATLADPGFQGWAAGEFLVEGSATAAAPAAPAAQAGGTSTERVAFAAGTTGAELTGMLLPGESRRYVLGASNGQYLYFRLAANGPGMSYQIFNPDGSFLLDQMPAAQEYRGQLWQSGDHVIEVINRGNGAQSYNVIFGIE